jgi:hypothetical protein
VADFKSESPADIKSEAVADFRRNPQSGVAASGPLPRFQLPWQRPWLNLMASIACFFPAGGPDA